MKGQIAAAIDAVRANPYSAAALAMYQAWTFASIYGVTSSLMHVSVSSGMASAPAIILAGGTCAYLAASLRWKTAMKAYRGRRFEQACIALVITGGVLAYFIPGIIEGGAQSAARTSGIALTGFAAALVNIDIAFAVMTLGIKSFLRIGICAVLGGAAAFLLLSHIPSAPCAALLVILPVGCCLCLGKAKKNASTRPDAYVYDEPKPPLRYFGTAALHGLSLGVLFALYPSFTGGTFLQAASLAAGAVLMAALALMLKADYNYLLYRAGIPLSALGILLVAVLPSFPIPGASINIAGFCFVNILMACLNFHFYTALKFPPVYIVGYATVFFSLGQLAGMASYIPLSALDNPEDAARMLACFTAFSLPVASLYFLSGKNLVSGWGTVTLDEVPPAGESFKAACSLLASDCGLKPRETEILPLLARGKSRKSIADVLCISEETVKTHASGIYRKLGVHSRQEVIELVEQTARRMNR